MWSLICCAIKSNIATVLWSFSWFFIPHLTHLASSVLDLVKKKVFTSAGIWRPFSSKEGASGNNKNESFHLSTVMSYMFLSFTVCQMAKSLHYDSFAILPPGANLPKAFTSSRLRASSPLSIWTMTYLPDTSWPKTSIINYYFIVEFDLRWWCVAH